ncbi:hypothetical protein HPP92_021682 [Vanilla planifolia]|uniref:Transcription repressor n=1 Tax=Vanilla planifolia TaxID=51239 RepID=A0A835PZB2_VANPL|nr:hypothetical protein HPP92_021682 [Vanilla planifolia]
MERRIRRMYRLRGLFRPSAFLRCSCANSTSAAAAAKTTQNPCFISHQKKASFDLDFSLLVERRSQRALLSADCGSCCPTRASLVGKEKRNNKKQSRVREGGGLYDSEEKKKDGRTCPPVSPISPCRTHHLYYYCFNEEDTKNKQKKKKKSSANLKESMKKGRRVLGSSSSIVSLDDKFRFLSSEESEERQEEDDEDEDSGTFFSSRSFSSEFSDFCKTTERKKKKGRKPSSSSLRRRRAARGLYCGWAYDGYRPLVSISTAEKRKEKEETKTAFSVVKLSTDPYGDFRYSMVEMIVEKQIFGARELQWLLHTYLSLNSLQNHPAILRAFADVSQALLGN